MTSKSLQRGVLITNIRFCPPERRYFIVSTTGHLSSPITSYSGLLTSFHWFDLLLYNICFRKSIIDKNQKSKIFKLDFSQKYIPLKKKCMVVTLDC